MHSQWGTRPVCCQRPYTSMQPELSAYFLPLTSAICRNARTSAPAHRLPKELKALSTRAASAKSKVAAAASTCRHNRDSCVLRKKAKQCQTQGLAERARTGNRTSSGAAVQAQHGRRHSTGAGTAESTGQAQPQPKAQLQARTLCSYAASWAGRKVNPLLDNAHRVRASWRGAREAINVCNLFTAITANAGGRGSFSLQAGKSKVHGSTSTFTPLCPHQTDYSDCWQLKYHVNAINQIQYKT